MCKTSRISFHVSLNDALKIVVAKYKTKKELLVIYAWTDQGKQGYDDITLNSANLCSVSLLDGVSESWCQVGLNGQSLWGWTRTMEGKRGMGRGW